MSRLKTIFRAAALMLSATSFPAVAQPIRQPTRVIFDTDMWGDIDDALALAILNTLQDRGEAEILAVTSSTDDKWCASYLNLFETYYGHPSLPVGLVRNGVKGHPEWMKTYAGRPNYTQYVSQIRGPSGALRFPHKLIDGSQAPDSIRVLRQTLAAQPDKSVVLVQVGFSTNFARLLDSKPDQYSSLSGIDLVKHKVRLLSMMAGSYADRNGKPLAKGQPEFNLMFDVPSARHLLAAWPTPIVASGFEIGASMLIKGDEIARGFNYATTHPVSATYRYADNYMRSSDTPAGHLHDHATFDLTSVLYAVRPDDGYFSLSPPGTISVQSDGSARFSVRPDGLHRYLIMDDAQRARALEAMTLLVTEPPTNRGK